MKLKRLTAMISSAVMVFSLLAGVTIAKPAKAAVTSELPTLNGLYVTSWIDKKWDDENQKDVALTDTDQNGNTVLVDWDGKAHNEYDEQYKMDEYYEKGLYNCYGLTFNAGGHELWFDYIEDGKVTHVNAEDLVFLEWDTGAPCTSVQVSANNDDPRIVDISASEVGHPVKVWYQKGSVNSQFVMTGALWSGIYSSASEASLDTYQHNHMDVFKKGTTVSYLHLYDSSWEEAGFEVDLKNLVSEFRYYDSKKDQEVDLAQTGDAGKYITFKQISKDKHHLVFKVLVKAIPTSDGWAHIHLSYKGYALSEPNNKWDNSTDIDINFVDGTAPAPAKGTTETIGGIKYKVTGKSAVSVVKGANKASVTIPAKVSIDGTSFKVTAIDAKAFNGCAKVKTLTVKSTTITKVGKNALKALKKKAVAKVPKSKKKAYAKLFKKGGFKGKVK